MNTPKILLLQARADDLKYQELNCFIEKSDIPKNVFTTFDLTSQIPTPDILNGIDMLIIGGAGDYCVSKNDLENQKSGYKLIKEARKRNLPILGMCYGAHMLTAALGGTVEQNKASGEVGTYNITLSQEAQKDDIFKGSPKSFPVQLGHNDHITKLPKNAVHLASSPLSKNQIWKMKDENIYAFQPHLELDKKGFIERVNFYKDDYIDSQEAYNAIIEKLKPTKEAEQILKRFMKKYLPKKGK